MHRIRSRHVQAFRHALFDLQYTANDQQRYGGELTPAAAQFGIDVSNNVTGTVSERVFSVGLMVRIAGSRCCRH